MTSIFKNKAYLFPLILTVLTVALTLARVSGTSVPVYSMLDGTIEEDRGLLANHPRGVRSDEWLVTTQLTIAQSAAGFPEINQNIAEGQDMAFQDVPYKSWAAVFMPHNFLFFIAPLEYAFAFKWWYVGLVLALGVYLVCLKFWPGKHLFASLGALIVLLSPMTVWWWQAGTLLQIGYSLLGVWLAIKLLEAINWKQRLFFAAALAYCFACFCFGLYPPFQLLMFILAVALLTGWFLVRYPKGERLAKLKAVGPFFALAALAGGAVLVGFYFDHREAIRLITQTVYPGTRVEVGGGLGFLHSLSSFLTPILQSDQRAASGFLVNQSAASSFIFITPYLAIPTLYVMWKRFRVQRSFSWPLVLTSAVIVLFLIKGYFTSSSLQTLYKLLLLDKVPDLRLLLGFGVAGIFHTLLLIREVKTIQLSPREKNILAILSGVGAFLVMALVARHVVFTYPDFAPRLRVMLLLALWVALAVFFIARAQWRPGLVLLVIFSFAATYQVHPLYRGLGAVTNSPVLTTIASYPDTGAWAVLDDRLMINFPLMAGKESVNSVHYYPQFELWQKLDPNKANEQVYNRFAHVLFSTETTQEFELKHTDLFLVRFDPCGAFAQQNIQHVLSPTPLEGPCVDREVATGTPLRPFFIYDVVAPSPASGGVASSSAP